MPTYEATVKSDRMVSLPQELCEHLAITDGTRVEFFLTLDGQVHFHALTLDANDLGQGLPKRRPPMSVREMDDGIVEAVTERAERALGPLPKTGKAAARTAAE